MIPATPHRCGRTVPRRLPSLLPLLLLALVGLAPSRAFASGTGDYNNDDLVDISDAILTLRAAVEILTPTSDELLRADLTDNKKLEVDDAIWILQIIVNIKPALVDQDKDGYALPTDCDDSKPGVNPAASDLPDVQLVDDNCDGIDGTISRALFVSANAGADANEGTREAPLKTIQAALAKAEPAGKDHIYVDAGTYNGPFTLKNGISIWGAFSRLTGWNRNLSFTSTLTNTTAENGRVVAVRGENLTDPTTLGDLIITTTSPPAFEVSNFGLHCKGCGGLRLERNKIKTDDATNGIPGKAGNNGGFAGDPGFPFSGSCDDNKGGFGGAGAALGTPRAGGNGGNGGAEGPHNGGDGGPGAGGAKGGKGGAYGDPGKRGGDGSPGSPGVPGKDGAGGAAGAVAADSFWTGFRGGNGTDGTDGQGGGGGGGGGAQTCSLCDDGTGNGGGGGGAGGLHGTAGTGGGPGGGSFGVFLVNSTGAVLTGNTIQTGNAGKGGSGGGGGDTGEGGKGGKGNVYCSDEIGDGGNGGDGGDGGRGGHGGGGTGGDSYPIYLFNTVATISANSYVIGTAGAGGISFGNPGAAGKSGNIKN